MCEFISTGLKKIECANAPKGSDDGNGQIFESISRQRRWTTDATISQRFLRILQMTVFHKRIENHFSIRRRVAPEIQFRFG